MVEPVSITIVSLVGVSVFCAITGLVYNIGKDVYTKIKYDLGRHSRDVTNDQNKELFNKILIWLSQNTDVTNQTVISLNIQGQQRMISVPAANIISSFKYNGNKFCVLPYGNPGINKFQIGSNNRANLDEFFQMLNDAKIMMYMTFFDRIKIMQKQQTYDDVLLKIITSLSHEDYADLYQIREGKKYSGLIDYTQISAVMRSLKQNFGKVSELINDMKLKVNNSELDPLLKKEHEGRIDSFSDFMEK